jgi:hypothetical protein
MSLVSVKQMLHAFFYHFWNTLKTGMLNPVLGCIFGERKVPQDAFCNISIQVQ